MKGAPLHGLTSLTHSTPGWPMPRAGNHLHGLVGGGLGARKKRSILELSKINYQARQSSILATMLNSDYITLTSAYPTNGNKAREQLSNEH